MSLALVTGASSGIGLQYATALARDYHTDLLLISNQEQEQIAVAQQLSYTYGVKTIPLYMNLAEQNAAEKVYDYCKENGLEVDILINNAGIFFFNPLIGTSMLRFETMLMLHVVTMAKLCRLFGEDMCRRGNGYILNMSSMSAWMAYPGIQTYNATKAFIYNFSKSLWYEFRPKGVGITVMTPGAVDTALFGLAPKWRKIAVRLTVSIPPEKLVVKALKRMFEKKKWGMPGLLNHLATPLLKHTPDWLVNLTYRWVGQFQK
ncbi:MAG: SDR family NAD(P)-dependent oxidoreductase [Paludibacteraceae bacterium]|nr:SDR family NAD(P)-dependent oxidoreductase [Paludibacteraceae bacterium]